MMNKVIWALTLLGTFAHLSYGDNPKVQHNPLQIGALTEMGVVDKGVYNASLGPKGAEEVNGEWIDHFAVFLNSESVVNDRLHVSAGLGGVFQFRKPEMPGLGFSASQRKGFFIGPSRTEAVYHFGDLDQPWLKIGMGMFPYKYNPEAANLGEYLFRSTAYPTTLSTGGYVVVGSAGAQLQGFKSNIQIGNLKADLFLTTETAIAPLYDWSLAGIMDYNLGDGLLHLGAGVNCQHLLQVRPGRTAPRYNENSYFKYNEVYYSGSKEFYDFKSSFSKKLADTLAKKTFTIKADSIANAQRILALRNLASHLDSSRVLVDSLLNDSLAKPKLGIKYFSASGVVVMGRATLDLKKLWSSEILGPDDLKLFGEVNLLGTHNYPIFYENRSDRVSTMLGFNFPGFRIFDLISLQVEYFKSPGLNNFYQRSNTSGGNIPIIPRDDDTVLSKNNYNDAADKDNFKWSVLLKKTFMKKLTFSSQLASDHLRLTNSSYYFGPQYDFNEITAFKDHWYWISQISWGI